VPLEAALPLLTVGGFAFAETSRQTIPFGIVRLHHDDAAACFFAGSRYLCTAKREVLVPAHAAAELSAHGFVPVCNDNGASPARMKTSPKSLRQKD
jgi:hypothetical protein